MAHFLKKLFDTIYQDVLIPEVRGSLGTSSTEVIDRVRAIVKYSCRAVRREIQVLVASKPLVEGEYSVRCAIPCSWKLNLHFARRGNLISDIDHRLLFDD